tara:strand:- start:40 stop:633 length:594 start_codon:yes stop_codon:yes gene_type:complete
MRNEKINKDKQQMKPITITFKDTQDLYKKAGLIHGRRISRGLQIQKMIYEKIKNSNKHLEVHHEFEIDLPIGGQKKSHKIDIVIIDTDSVRAFDSKSQSFNATQDAQGVLEEYQKYIHILQEKFPNKKIEYSVLKEEWDNPSKNQCTRYTYMNTRGVKVFDTYNFMLDNYGVSKEELIDNVDNNIFEQVRVISETHN